MSDPTNSPTSDSAGQESFLPNSTILIVDDNAQNVELLQAFLESLPVENRYRFGRGVGSP
ncbi:MAG: hypothetical protein KatS3mg104_0307 [Phycisphaerae bacterium]|nr:MAG: hypothetical protein KatS3mg104_0307 [Phycisphaerae bacterium]